MRLVRTTWANDGITGKLLDDDGYQLAVTLEHSYDGQSKIPSGVYRCVRRYSPRFARDVFMLEHVPGHEFIEFHVANWQHDLDGCIGLGREVIESHQGTMITDSNMTFTKFMRDLDGIESFMLTIEEGVRT